jgi:hypothetical protein
MRIALQAGIPQRMVPPASRELTRWTLVRSEAEAHAIETPWITLHTSSDDAITPGSWLARLAVRLFGPSLLHAGSNANMVVIASVVSVLMGVVAAWFGYITVGLFFAGLGWTIRNAAALLSRVEHDSLQSTPTRWPREAVFGWVFDAVLIMLISWGMPQHPWDMTLERAFPPLVLVGLLRLLPRAFDARLMAWLEDRLVLTLVLVATSIAGALDESVYLLAAALALSGIAFPRNSSRITSV